MRLQQLARTLAAAALTSCGGSPATPAEQPVVWTRVDPADLALVPVEPELPPPPPVVAAKPPDAIPRTPGPLVNARRWGAVSRADVVLAIARRPAGTKLVLYRGSSIFGPPEWKLCPDFDGSCKPWPDHDQIGFVDARRRVKRLDWKDLAKDSAQFAKLHGEADLHVQSFERIAAGSYDDMFWFEDGKAIEAPRSRRSLSPQMMPAVLRLRPERAKPAPSKIDRDRLPGEVIQLRDFDLAKPKTPAEGALAALYDRHRGSFPGQRDLAIVRELAIGYLITFLDDRSCGIAVIDESAFVIADGPPTLVYAGEPWTNPCRNPGGRRPPGLVPRELDVLAELAHLEAASVASFERIACELAAFGAPPELVARAREAARDEARHAHMVGLLAGCEPRVDIRETPPRDAFAFALDNAVEGCVREAFAAIVCAYQAIAAEDPAVAEVMSAIADDEARHGELAWAIAAWLEPRLTPAQQHAIAGARRAALTALDATPEASSARLGLPPPATLRFLATAYRARVSDLAS